MSLSSTLQSFKEFTVSPNFLDEYLAEQEESKKSVATSEDSVKKSAASSIEKNGKAETVEEKPRYSMTELIMRVLDVPESEDNAEDTLEASESEASSGDSSCDSDADDESDSLSESADDEPLAHAVSGRVIYDFVTSTLLQSNANV